MADRSGRSPAGDRLYRYWWTNAIANYSLATKFKTLSALDTEIAGVILEEELEDDIGIADEYAERIQRTQIKIKGRKTSPPTVNPTTPTVTTISTVTHICTEPPPLLRLTIEWGKMEESIELIHILGQRAMLDFPRYNYPISKEIPSTWQHSGILMNRLSSTTQACLLSTNQPWLVWLINS